MNAELKNVTGTDDSSSSILEVENLQVVFSTEEGEIRAVDGVTFSARRGKVMGIVGESGCGKSVTAYSILRLIQDPGRITGGRITFTPAVGEPVVVTDLNEKSEQIYDLRGGSISMIFQEPMTALSPVHTVGNQICEAILLHQDMTVQEAEEKACDMLGRVGIPAPSERLHQYPFEMSGGMRQRAVIAMALVCDPELLIADEPTTALDVTIQAQIMDLLKKLQTEMGTSVLLITHDLGVVAQMADDVTVMYLGNVMERAPVKIAMKEPAHPYTRALLASLPSLNRRKERLPSIEGSVPSLAEMPAGCPFHPRCGHCRKGLCDAGSPPELEAVGPNHDAACFRITDLADSW